MIVAIHQPGFIPYLGFFHKWANCDLFVFLDDVQYPRRQFVNRNKIKTPNGAKWITIPVKQKGKYQQTITETQADNKKEWVKKVLNSVKLNYAKAPYFHYVYTEFRDLLGGYNLSIMNVHLCRWMASELGLHLNTKRSSWLDGIEGASTERLISICKTVGANTYLSGPSGKNYQDEKLFEDAGIKVIYSSFKHPQYPQLWGEFD